MVLAPSAGGNLEPPDVAELREGAEELSALNRWPIGELARLGNAEEWVPYRLAP